MPSAISPNQSYTFTIAKLPRREAQHKTLMRLMRMQPSMAKAHRKLAQRRKRQDNEQHQRGGRMWTSRVKVAKIAYIEPGASFTLHVTPQLLPDVRSIETCLKVSKAS